MLRPVTGFLVLVILGFSPISRAQTDIFYTRGSYRPQVPRPSTITGFEPGLAQSTYDQVVRVAEKITAAAPERMRLLENGQTWEHRKLYLAVVSAPENIARLDQIKRNLARLADPRQTSAAEAATIARTTPLVVWLNFGIHGNESASYEAVQQVLYQLAASDEPATLNILKNVVVVINLMHNPDGHERFAVWENSVAIGNAEPLSLEHEEPYQLYGRLNHYRFDLNRDMLALSQPENLAFAQAVRAWHPQVLVDFHGQVSNYFFPPTAEPINKNLPLAQTKFWYDKFGRGNAAAFDHYGWNYYVRHIFDLFMAGYIDSWSSLNGATGMTYESDGGGPLSLNYTLDDETVLTFRQGIAKHVTAALATLETASNNRVARLNDYYQFFETAIEEGQREALKQVVLVPGADPGHAAHLVQNLLREGIEVNVARQNFRLGDAHDYLGSPATSQEIPAGSYLISFAQPQKRLAKAHLEPNAQVDEGFMRQELARKARNEKRSPNLNQENYEFYDLTAWSLPLALGVEAYWSGETSQVKTVRVLLNPETSQLRASDDQPLSGLQGALIGGQATSAYLIPYGSEASIKLTVALLQEGFKIAVATRQLNAGGRNWPAGTLIVRTSRNPETLFTRLSTLVTRTGATVYGLNSAYSEQGDTGIGSESVLSLKVPKVAVLWDEATEPTSYGALWYGLEQRFGLAFTPLSIKGLKELNLSHFTTIVIPDGLAETYEATLGKEGIAKLKTWTDEGGVLIGLGGGAQLFTHKEVNFTSSRLVGATASSEEKDPPQDTPKQSPGSLKPIAVPGAAFRVKLDRDHFLSYGYPSDTLAVLVNGDAFFRPSKNGANVAVFSAKSNLAGFIWPGNTEPLLLGTAYVIDEPTPKGHVLLFSQDPNFRDLWRTATPMFFNALLFAPVLH